MNNADSAVLQMLTRLTFNSNLSETDWKGNTAHSVALTLYHS